MEFLNVVGSRRSIRWFRTWRPVELEKIQRILEAARQTGCPGNLQPWRAVVVVQSDLAPEEREALLDAGNRQRPHEQAPVWIYWFADPSAVAPSAFLHQVRLGMEVGALAPGAGWDAEAARVSIESGEAAPPGMPRLDQTVYQMPPEISAIVASQETVGACTTAVLAAVNEGLGTCLHLVAAPASAAVVYETLGIPSHFVPVWLQLVGYPAESPDAGGARPRDPFEALFSIGRWGDPFPRDAAVVDRLRQEGLIQPDAPLPGRHEEVEHLSRMFGYVTGHA